MAVAHTSNTWEDLARCAQKGDKRAYERLLKEIAKFTRSYTAASLSNPDWLDDLVQMVLISVHKALPTYSAAKAFKPWLISIINFRRADVLRAHYKQQERGELSLDIEGSEDILLAQHVTNAPLAGEYKDIEAALARLGERQRQLIVLAKIEGHSMQEIADQMNMSLSAVKVGVHRALKTLKEAGLDG